MHACFARDLCELQGNPSQRDFTAAQRYRGQCAEGSAAGLRGLAGIILASEHKGVTCSVLEQSAWPAQREEIRQMAVCLNQEANKYILGTYTVSHGSSFEPQV